MQHLIVKLTQQEAFSTKVDSVSLSQYFFSDSNPDLLKLTPDPGSVTTKLKVDTTAKPHQEMTVANLSWTTIVTVHAGGTAALFGRQRLGSHDPSISELVKFQETSYQHCVNIPLNNT